MRSRPLWRNTEGSAQLWLAGCANASTLNHDVAARFTRYMDQERSRQLTPTHLASLSNTLAVTGESTKSRSIVAVTAFTAPSLTNEMKNATFYPCVAGVIFDTSCFGI